MKLPRLFSLIIAALVMVSCSKHAANKQPQQSPDSSNSIRNYYSFQVGDTTHAIDSVRNRFQTQFWGSDTAGVAILCPPTYPTLDTEYFAEGITGVYENPPAGATMGKLDTALNGQSISYGYSPSNPRIEIFWIDAEGVAWATNLGTEDQTGSSFHVDSTSMEAPWGFILNATFNCNFYDSTGDVKVITNGKSRMLFF
jgi:hypothetical protein